MLDPAALIFAGCAAYAWLRVVYSRAPELRGPWVKYTPVATIAVLIVGLLLQRHVSKAAGLGFVGLCATLVGVFLVLFAPAVSSEGWPRDTHLLLAASTPLLSVAFIVWVIAATPTRLPLLLLVVTWLVVTMWAFSCFRHLQAATASAASLRAEHQSTIDAMKSRLQLAKREAELARRDAGTARSNHAGEVRELYGKIKSLERDRDLARADERRAWAEEEKVKKAERRRAEEAIEHANRQIDLTKLERLEVRKKLEIEKADISIAEWPLEHIQERTATIMAAVHRQSRRNGYSPCLLADIAAAVNIDRARVLRLLEAPRSAGEIEVHLPANRRHEWAEEILLTDTGKAKSMSSSATGPVTITGDGNVLSFGGQVREVSVRVVTNMPRQVSGEEQEELEAALERVAQDVEALQGRFPAGDTVVRDLRTFVEETQGASDPSRLNLIMRGYQGVAQALGDVGLPLMKSTESVLKVLDSLL